jgi:hypothetical protein
MGFAKRLNPSYESVPTNPFLGIARQANKKAPVKPALIVSDKVGAQ